MSYQDYLQSDKWKQKREMLKEAYGHKCSKCHWPDDLEIHHIQYPESLEQDSFANLTVLCRKCHQKVHGYDHRDSYVHIGTVIEQIRKKYDF